MSAVKLQSAAIAPSEVRVRPTVAGRTSHPVASPARQLQAGLGAAFTESRWSLRRTLAFVGVTSASLWGLIIAGGVALLS